MMLFFWKNWNTSHRAAYWTGLVLFCTAIAGMIWTWIQGLQNVIRWDVLSELTALPASIGTFTDGLFDYAVAGKSYIVTEQFVASAMQVNVVAAKLATLGICVGLVFILAAITRLQHRNYLIVMGLLIVLVATFRLEVLQLPGFLGRVFGGRLTFVLLVVVFGVVSYYFHAFKSYVSLPVRLGVFAGMLLLGWLAVDRLAGQPFPASAFIGYALPGLLVVSLGFIFWISTEIIAALVYITSVARNNRSDGSGRPLGMNSFLLISLLYLANLLLIWLSNTKAITWNPVVISPFVLFLISLILGIWGIRQQLRQNETVLSFRDAGAFLYLGLSLITVMVIAYAFASANDPLVEALEDIIVYTHLASGLMFVVYVFINFLPIYRQGLPVYKVLYKPLQLSVLQTRLVAAVLTCIIGAYQSFFTFNQATAGYFNTVGDFHAATGELRVAEQYYTLALANEFQNHKSNYALASLALTQGDKVSATYYFQQALLKQPSPQAYAGLTSVLLQDNLLFEAIKLLQRGIRVFPKNGELQNNLGYLYARTSVADSAYYYLAAASGNTAREEIPQTNLLAFWVRNPRLVSLDSLAKTSKASSYESYEANRAALAFFRNTADSSTVQRPGWFDEPVTGQGLNVARFARLYNYSVQNRTADTTLLNVLNRLGQNPANQDFTDDLLFAQAAVNYYTANKRTAFELTDQLARDNERNGAFYNFITGLWMMEQGLNRKAADMLAQNADTLSMYYQALALTKSGDPLVAQSLWETAGQNDPGVQHLAEVLYDRKQPATDLEKAFTLLYNPSVDQPGPQLSLYRSMQDDNLKTIVAAVFVKRYLAASQLPVAQSWYEQIPQEAKLNGYAGSAMTIAYLRLRNAKGQYDQTLTDARQSVVAALQAEKDFVVAQAYQAKRQTAQASRSYEDALRRAPFNAEIVAAAAGFEQQNSKAEKGYNLVLEALPMNERNPDLLKMYALLCLDLSLNDYAEESLKRLRAVTSPADYQAFLARYQAKRALIEKQREAFQ
jgi:Tfp pilus assembly protein PilF